MDALVLIDAGWEPKLNGYWQWRGSSCVFQADALRQASTEYAWHDVGRAQHRVLLHSWGLRWDV